ncbi:hypothetical protein TCAL_00251 [Tigriopus californicus]|uniref:Uncharacterized protein n=1 Tax=Tigriopus californicus TaxID=6832 RepID=A0A553P380_TIGCA|nr:uncharacterized protein LOC131883811 isoform X2 [Tigriopus californicus]XP_059087372.1 uncharacterized protein LOC131883811 isoform X2 [Tigriopus californicus]XP_059087373.1 uncharacterized protein LOC131883811 isoform X2 [Tigriopus californicus]TRY72156.1 hypothetical protein TCAL_00251 [Tigriopus californicus]
MKSPYFLVITALLSRYSPGNCIYLYQDQYRHQGRNFWQDRSIQACPTKPSKNVNLSRNLASEMSRLVEDMRQQIRSNVRDLGASLDDANYRSLASAFGYTVQILTTAGEYFIGNGIASVPQTLSSGGAILESGGYNFEPFAFLRPFSPECVSNFEPMVTRYRIQDRLQGLELQKQCLNATTNDLLPEKERLRLDILSFRRDFQENLSCALSSRTLAGRQRLLGLLKLYTRGATIRLSKI